MPMIDEVDDTENAGYLTGQLLVAMPGMTDERFAQTVIYMCAHNAEGAMGLVLNKPMDSVTFPDLLEQLNIEPAPHFKPIEVHFGGPVETGRGFVLHSPDYIKEATMMVDDQVALTATIDIIQAIANGEGPRHSLFALGYAGWGPGQLDSEIKANGWLHVAADDKLVFREKAEFKWDQAMLKIGIDPRMLSDKAGHA